MRAFVAVSHNQGETRRTKRDDEKKQRVLESRSGE